MAQNNNKRRRVEEAFEEEEHYTRAEEPEMSSLLDNTSNFKEEMPSYMLPMPTINEKYPQRRKTGAHWGGYGSALLDNYNGQGSMHVHKKEHAAMFPPMPNDPGNVNEIAEQMERERTTKEVATSNHQGGVRPFEPIHTRGDMPNYLMQRIDEPTVDDLRSAARPKPQPASLDGYQGPAGGIQVPAMMPEHAMMKTKTADTFYENTPEMWFTTKGAVTASASYATEKQNDRHTARETYADVQYAGHATGTLKYSEKGYYEPSTRIEYQGDELPVGIVGRTDTGSGYLEPIGGPRSVAPRLKAPPIIALVGAFGSFVAPLMDLVRDRKSEEEALRPYGTTTGLSGAVMSVGPEVPSQGPAPTKKDMLPQNNHLFIERTNNNNGGAEEGYLFKSTSAQTERSRAVQQTYFGIGSSGSAPLGMNPYLSGGPPVVMELRNNVRAVTAMAARTTSGRGNTNERPDFSGAMYRPDIQEDKRTPAPKGSTVLPTLEGMGKTRLRPDASISDRLNPSLIITDDVRKNPLLLPKGGIYSN